MEIRQYRHGYISNHVEQNIEEYAACLKDFDLRIMQLSKGSFRGRSGIIRLPGITLIRRTSLTKYSMSGCFDGNINFAFPLNSECIYYNGSCMDNNRQIVSTTCGESHAIIPEHSDQLLISIPQQSLSLYLDPAETEVFLTQVRIIANSRVDVARKRLLTVKLLTIFEFIHDSPAPLSPADMLNVGQGIMGMLFDFLVSHHKLRQSRRSSHEKIVDRTMRLVESDISRQFTLEEISKEIFASKRAIQCAFSAILGISPMRYAKIRRINQVRGELADVITALNFTEVVTKYSFTNASRLCREYRDLFGEHPKETHRQIAAVHACI